MNFFTGNGEPRAYYLSVTPVEITHETYGGKVVKSRCTTAFSGTKQVVLQVKRQSPKGLAEALKLAEPLKANLIAHVLAKNKLTLAQAQGVKA